MAYQRLGQQQAEDGNLSKKSASYADYSVKNENTGEEQLHNILSPLQLDIEMPEEGLRKEQLWAVIAEKLEIL